MEDQHFQVIKPSSKQAQEQKEAESVYRQLTNLKQITQEGFSLCKMLEIDPKSLHPKKIEEFTSQHPEDPQIAQLHLQHYTRARFKNLQRLAKHLKPGTAARSESPQATGRP